ncbi:MAG: hypothetical protein KBF88_04075 [Polyangiaceae bacterium]|nr:hypothetical protein [Polyangiaceae bacterium]
MGLFMAMSMIGVLWFTMGVGKMLLSRERAQDAADTMAHGVALVQARGMNIISAYNIVMLGLVFLHIVTRLGQAIMFFILQAIGLPEAGFNSSPVDNYLEQRVYDKCIDFPGAGNRQDPSNPAHDGTETMSLTIPYSYASWPAVKASGWACAAVPAVVADRPLNSDGTEVRGRLAWYNEKTGLNIPSNLPARVVENHNYLRRWDIGAETGFAAVYRSIQDEQRRVRDDYSWQANEGAIGAIVQRYNTLGSLPNMRVSGQNALGSGSGATLPVSFSESHATLQELCADLLFMDAYMAVKTGNAETSGENMWATTRAFGPILRNDTQIFSTGSISSLYAQTTNGAFARAWFCDNLSAGASGGVNYWTLPSYRYPVVDPSVQNGSPRLRIWSDVNNQFTDTSVAKVSIPSRQIATGGDTSYRSYASAETFFACDGVWTSSRCNGNPSSGGNYVSRQNGTFKTNWAARLVRVNSPGAPVGGANVLH